MQDLIDIRTTLLIAASTSLGLAACMIYISTQRRVYPGFHAWTLGALLMGVATVLMALREFLPLWLTIVVANPMAFAEPGLFVVGLRSFTGKESRAWVLVPLGLVLAAAFAYLTYVHPDLTARIILASLVMAGLGLEGYRLAGRPVREVLGGPNRLLRATFAFLAIWFFLRAVFTYLWGDAGSNFMRAGVIQQVSVLGLPLVNIFTISSLIILNNQRLEKDLRAAQDEAETLRGFLPICANCKKIRDDEGFWTQVEDYVAQRSEATFSQSICPDCAMESYLEKGGDDKDPDTRR